MVALAVSLIAIAITILEPSPNLKISCFKETNPLNNLDFSTVIIKNKGKAPAENFVLKIENWKTGATPSSLNINYEHNTLCKYKVYRGRFATYLYGNAKIITDNNQTNFYLDCEYIPPKSQIPVGFDGWIENFNISFWARNHKGIKKELICEWKN